MAAWVVRHRLKPLFQSAPDVAALRAAMNVVTVRRPSGVTITEALWGEWVEGPKAGRTLLYLHGGGYIACSPLVYRPITAAFARSGFRVFAPDYRLAPEHVFPAALDDCRAAFLRLQEKDSRPIFLAGDSAGGGLALALMLSLRDRGEPLPGACALFSPWTDLASTGASIEENESRCAMFTAASIRRGASFYLGGADPRDPLASPLYGKFEGLPPLLIHVGADETLRDDSIRVAEKARAAGVRVELKIWPAVAHAWQLAPWFIPEARQSLDEAAAFFR